MAGSGRVEWKVVNGRHWHPGSSGFGLRAGPAIQISISLCRNWGPLEPLSVPWPLVCPGRVVAVGRLDGMVELWAWQEGALTGCLPAHQNLLLPPSSCELGASYWRLERAARSGYRAGSRV